LGEVGEDAGEPVGGAAFKQQVMRAFMDHYEKGMIGEGAEQIGDADDYPPGLVFYHPCQGYLEQDQAKDCEKGVLVLSDKLSHFRMLLQDLFGAKPVRLLLNGINKVGSL